MASYAEVIHEAQKRLKQLRADMHLKTNDFSKEEGVGEIAFFMLAGNKFHISERDLTGFRDSSGFRNLLRRARINNYRISTETYYRGQKISEFWLVVEISDAEGVREIPFFKK